MFRNDPLWKYKIMNFIIGGAIAVIVSTLLVLGLKIFIPPPQYPAYSYDYNSCASGDQACYERQQRESRDRQEEYTKLSKTYGGKIFIAANVAGIIVLLLGILCFALGLGTNIGVGIILSGAFGIIYGYALGWAGADDAVKFGVGVVVALILIGGGVAVNRMHAKAAASVSMPGSDQIKV